MDKCKKEKAMKAHLFKFVKLVMLASLLLICSLASTANAESNTSPMLFNFQTVAPDNQKTEGNYFDLKISAGTKQELNVAINNMSDKELEIQAELLQAVTTGVGKISYSKDKKLLIDSPTIDINKVISVPKSVVVPKKSTKIMKIMVDVPKDFTEGTILAGVELTNKKTEEVVKTQNNTVENTYAYLFSIALNQEKKAKPAVTIKDTELVHENKQAQLKLSLDNHTVDVLREISIKTVIHEEKSNKMVMNQVDKGKKMTPESAVVYKINVPELAPGKYEVTHTVKFSDKSGETFTKKIEVDESFEEKQIVSEDKKEQKKPHYLVIGLCILAVILIVVAIFLMKKRKH